MKIVIEIPEKTNAHIRSDYGHDTKGLRDEDREILCDAIYNGTPYEDRPHGEWILDAVAPHSISWFRCSYCGYKYEAYKQSNFCPNCGSDMRKEGNRNVESKS